MDASKRPPNPNPLETANFLSKLFFGYVVPMWKTGYTRDLTAKDIYDTIPELQASLVGHRLESVWNEEKKKKHPSFMRAIIFTFRSELLSMALHIVFVELFLRLAQPILMGQLLLYFETGSTISLEHAYLTAGMMCAVNLLLAFASNHYSDKCSRCGVKLRIACCFLINRKVLKLSQNAFRETATGKIINLLSNDVSHFETLSQIIHYIWISPLTAIFITIFVYFNVGIPGVLGMSVFFLFIPIQAYCGILVAKFRKKSAPKTDNRIRLMEEIIRGIQVIKMYAWEYPFSKIVKYSRKLETTLNLKIGIINSSYICFILFTTRCAMYVVIISMAKMGVMVTANQLFMCNGLFGLLSFTMSQMFVRSLADTGEITVTLKRIENFLLLEEYDKRQNTPVIELNVNNTLKEKKVEKPEYAICMNYLSSTWNSNSQEMILSDVNMRIPHGKFVAVIGSVGSGKSSVLQTLLKEMFITKGSMTIDGTLSYACQEAWVFAASIRQNILFGAPYNKVRYKEVVNVCELRKDFDMFPNGDMTMVGDRGVSLSGGQKARINLARAIYRDTDIYLLDDPLSAVDSRVAKNLFEKCIKNYLATKTRILVTHHLQFLEQADHLVILKDGKIQLQGTFSEISKSGLDFAQLLTTNIVEEETVEENVIIRSRTNSFDSINSIKTLGLNENAELKAKVAEQSSKGKVKGNMLWMYFRKGNNIFSLAVIFLLFILTQVTGNCCDYFVSFWIDNEEYRRSNSTWPDYQSSQLSQQTEIYIYSGLIITLFLIVLTRSLCFCIATHKSSLAIHHSIFMGVIKTKMHFFYTNPLGRILNRFSQDMGAVDDFLPRCIIIGFQNILIMSGAMMLSFLVCPYLLIPITIVGVLFYFHTKVFTKSSKNIKRLEGITRSSIFSHLSATLQGLSTVRAFNTENILQNEYEQLQNVNSGTWFLFISFRNLYGFGLDLMCFIFTTTIIITFINISGDISVGEVGLAITQALLITRIVQIGLRQAADIQNQLAAVERVLEYAECEPEDNFEGESSVPTHWPQNGKIKFTNVQVKYSKDEPYILHNLNIDIMPREKIGIVGRTGAGKSSLVGALFRLIVVEGSIEIDGIDTRNVPLQTLRKSISIIPQDPILFSGTMRSNLDPFDEYDDETLWSALEDVELKNLILQNNNLETRILDHGSNFSVGQRQLVCLARAILKKNKILILDEATANVDPMTDALIQKTIREKFADCTVLTVAHRLNTIMDSDKVLVMAAGQVVEFDSPYVLCENHNSLFYQMINETGATMTNELCKAAKDSYFASIEITEL